MLFAVIFKDHPDRATLRQALLPSHIKWLDTNKDLVLVGGSLREQLDQNPIGGLWLVEAKSKAEVQLLIASDPFLREGLRKSCDIFHWSKAFQDRKVLV